MRYLYILSEGLGDFYFVHLEISTRKCYLGAFVEGNMSAVQNSFMGWNLNLNKKIATAQLAPQIPQQIHKHFY